MNVVYAGAAYPLGALSDRMNRISMLALGLVVLIAADLVLAFAPNLAVVGIGIALWGLHMAMTQGLLAALVADTAPAELRGTAYGMLNLLCGLAMLVASVLAGALRSEEHTSELQSLMRISYAVFCLKKKRTRNTQT